MKPMPAILLSAFVAAVGVLADPVLVITPEEADLGKVTPNAEGAAFKFAIKNTGDQPLKIENVRPFCGCTTVELAKKELAPNEEVELTGVLKTEHYEGLVSKGIAISTNDPKTPQKIVRVTARLPFSQTGLRLQSKVREVSAYKIGDALRLTVRVENCDAEGAAQVTAVDLPEGWKVITPLPVEVKPEAAARVEFEKPLGGAEPVEFSGAPFVIHTDHAETKVLEGKIRYTKPRSVPPPPPPVKKPEAAAPAPAGQAPAEAPTEPAKEQPAPAPEEKK
ncbi:MAG: hypothetical protein BWZ02_01345 [Lentisphaerae bacterium ADurb.BinA184]|nr:MAG: hypothetical protein BWZ02_01345 [Lentisphaerae bacterium ADurb.BinA184]